MTGIWQKLMKGWCWVIILFGAVLMGGAFASADGPSQYLLAILGGRDPAMDAPLRFAVGLMGAVTFGWGLTALAVTSISHLLDASGARLLWRRVTAAIMVWYLVDSVISLATGFGLNAISNTLLMGAFLVIARGSGVLSTHSANSARQVSARA